MMNKILYSLIVLLLAFSIVGCEGTDFENLFGGSSETEEVSETETASEEQEVEPALEEVEAEVTEEPVAADELDDVLGEVQEGLEDVIGEGNIDEVIDDATEKIEEALEKEGVDIDLEDAIENIDESISDIDFDFENILRGAKLFGIDVESVDKEFRKCVKEGNDQEVCLDLLRLRLLELCDDLGFVAKTCKTYVNDIP